MMAFGHHRPVKVQINAIQLTRIGDSGKDHISDSAEGVVGNKATGFSSAPQDRNEFDIASIKGLRGGPGNGKIQPDSFVHNLFAKKHFRPAVSDLEIVKRGSGRGEGVGLVLEAGDGDPFAAHDRPVERIISLILAATTSGL